MKTPDKEQPEDKNMPRLTIAIMSGDHQKDAADTDDTPEEDAKDYSRLEEFVKTLDDDDKEQLRKLLNKKSEPKGTFNTKGLGKEDDNNEESAYDDNTDGAD